LIILGFGVSSVFLIFLAEWIINPKNEDSDALGFYSEQVAENVPEYMLIATISFTVIAIIGIILVFPYEKESSTKAALMNNDTYRSINIGEETPQETVKKAVLSKKFLACFSMSLCSSCI
jgi:hypothetical protein